VENLGCERGGRQDFGRFQGAYSGGLKRQQHRVLQSGTGTLEKISGRASAATIWTRGRPPHSNRSSGAGKPAKIDVKISEVEKARIEAYSGLQQQCAAFPIEPDAVCAHGQPGVRGRLGRSATSGGVVEIAGC